MSKTPEKLVQDLIMFYVKENYNKKRTFKDIYKRISKKDNEGGLYR